MRTSIKALPPNFLEVTKNEYYRPGDYSPDINFRKLKSDPSKINGMDSLYFKNGTSRGRFSEENTMHEFDTNKVLSEG